MSNPWLHIIGLGDNGRDSLSPDALAALEEAKIIIGGKRHLSLVGPTTAKQLAWPSPFDHLLSLLEEQRKTPTAILVSGDPLWHSAGSKIAAAFPKAELCIHPQLSAFQLAAARMAWRFEPANCITLHGRDHAMLNRHLVDGKQLLVLTSDGQAVSSIAAELSEQGFGKSKLTALSHLGGTDESRHVGLAETWAYQPPDLNTLAIEVIGPTNQPVTSQSAGRPDEAFAHDGKITKAVIRAATLAKLAPQDGALLWDIGLGSGSIATEWLRSGHDMRAIGLEMNDERIALARQNANKFGVPQLEIIKTRCPEGLEKLPKPDAIFFGGGIMPETIALAIDRLGNEGRLVANAVTLESEQILLMAHKTYGGTLERIQSSKAEPVGALTGWRPSMPVTQWSFIK